MKRNRPPGGWSKLGSRAITLGLLSALSGCASVQPAALYARFEAHAPAHAPAAPPDRPMKWSQVVDACAKADVIFFGEEHNDIVCNQLEAELLGALVERGRRPALSMEFFERDTQASLDGYLASSIDESAFRKQARQGKNYPLSHRPLIEMARRFDLPVVAANTPRPAVRAYRQSDKPFDAYRATLSESDRAMLPARVYPGDDNYRKRFFAIMGLDESTPASAPTAAAPPVGVMTPATASAPASAPATAAHGPITPESVAKMYHAQLVWDSAMAESIAAQRQKQPGRPVMHVVGGFHVAHEGGLVQAYRQLRKRDRVVRIVYRSTTETNFAPETDDRTAADILLIGLRPAREEDQDPS